MSVSYLDQIYNEHSFICYDIINFNFISENLATDLRAKKLPIALIYLSSNFAQLSLRRAWAVVSN